MCLEKRKCSDSDFCVLACNFVCCFGEGALKVEAFLQSYSYSLFTEGETFSYSQVGGTRKRQGENKRTLISHPVPQIYGIVMLPWHTQTSWILRKFQLSLGFIDFSNRRKQQPKTTKEKEKQKNTPLIKNNLLKVKSNIKDNSYERVSSN